MKLGKKIGRIGFVVGFLGPVLFYLPDSFTWESLVCPWRPCIDGRFSTPLFWVRLGLTLGLVQGLTFALLGFGAGFFISKTKTICNSLTPP